MKGRYSHYLTAYLSSNVNAQYANEVVLLYGSRELYRPPNNIVVFDA